MNYLKLTLILTHIFLETTIFPNYTSTYLNRASMFYSLLLIGPFFVSFGLRKYNRIFIILLSCADLFLSFTLINRFYDSSFLIENQMNLFIILMITLSCYLFNRDTLSLSEYKNSPNLNTFFSSLLKLIQSYLIFYSFKTNHYKSARKLDLTDAEGIKKLDYVKLATEFGVDFLIFNHLSTVINLIKRNYTKNEEKRKNLLRNIFSRVVLLLLVTLAFYANYNTHLTDLVYEKFMQNVPQPHNVILYNCMPLDADVRFRLVLTGLLYLFN